MLISYVQKFGQLIDSFFFSLCLFVDFMLNTQVFTKVVGFVVFVELLVSEFHYA